MDSLNALLKSKKQNEPPQIEAIKKYVFDAYAVDIKVKVSSKYYLITAPTAALAHQLRIETSNMISICHLDKKLVIHIG